MTAAAVDLYEAQREREQMLPPPPQPEPESMSVDDNVLLAETRIWILKVAQDEEAALSLNVCGIMDAVDSDGRDDGHDAAVEEQESWTADGVSEPSFIGDLSVASDTIRRHNINNRSSTPKNMSIARSGRLRRLHGCSSFYSYGGGLFGRA